MGHYIFQLFSTLKLAGRYIFQLLEMLKIMVATRTLYGYCPMIARSASNPPPHAQLGGPALQFHLHKESTQASKSCKAHSSPVSDSYRGPTTLNGPGPLAKKVE